METTLYQKSIPLYQKSIPLCQCSPGRWPLLAETCRKNYYNISNTY